MWTPSNSAHQGCGHTQTTPPASPENTAILAAQPDLSTDTDCPSWRGGLPGPAALHDSTSSTTPVWRDWAVFREMGSKHKMLPERHTPLWHCWKKQKVPATLGKRLSSFSYNSTCTLHSAQEPSNRTLGHVGQGDEHSCSQTQTKILCS